MPTLRLGAIGALAGLACAACTTTPVDSQQDMLKAAVPFDTYVRQQPAAAAQAYRLQVRDVIDLRFHRAVDLNETATVRPDGRVTLPWAGEVQAAGLTPMELTREVEKAYVGVLRNPKLEVIVRTFQPSRIFVGGEVRRPGELQLNGALSLRQAIVQQGDFTPDAQRDSVIVVRQRGAESPEYIHVDFGTARVTKLALAGAAPCSPENPLACPGAQPLRPEAFMLEPLDLVIVPMTEIAGVAQFFERYVDKILPIWRNLGLSATWLFTRNDTVVVPTNQ